MIVFNKYFKIVKQHLGTIIMFTAICVIVTIINTNYNTQDSFKSVENNIAIINHDNSKIVDNYIKYIDKGSNLIDIKDDKKEFQDALYSNKVDAIIIIPENFTKDLLDNKNPSVKIKKSNQSFSMITELQTNKYFNLINLYANSGMDEELIIENINKSLDKEVDVKIIGNNDLASKAKLYMFFSFTNYSFLAIFIFIIGTIMCIFNKETIVKRNTISSEGLKSIYRQLLLGHILLTLIIWLVYVIFSIILFKEMMFTMNGLLYIIGSLCFAITCTCLAYFIGTLIKKESIISGVQNVVSLGLSFISGSFVDRTLLDSSIVNFSKIFPSYWYIDVNYRLYDTSTYNMDALMPIFKDYIIILLFGILFIILSKLVVKFKRK